MEHRPFTFADLEWLVARHADLYGREAGFGPAFAGDVRAVAEGFLARADPAEAAWIPWQDGMPQGSLFLVRDRDDARLKLVLLEPARRGQGHGRALLALAMRTARANGYPRIRVSTYDLHAAACRLYAAAGFAETARLPARAYGRSLVERRFSRPL